MAQKNPVAQTDDVTAPAAQRHGKGKGGKAVAGPPSAGKSRAASTERLPRRLYEHELYRLQAELVKAQEWVRTERARIVVIFEGRDAAGKGLSLIHI